MIKVNLSRKNIYFAVFFTAVSLVAIGYFFQKTKNKIILQNKAYNLNSVLNEAKTPTIDDFRFNFNQLKKMFPLYNRNINLFGGNTVLAEFENGDNKIYAGHLGSFWAPPFFSNFGDANIKNNWQNGANTGLVIKSNDSCFAEEPTEDLINYASWDPSKSVVTKFYPEKGIKIVSTRFALAEKRGYGMKIEVENISSENKNVSLMFFNWLKTFDKREIGGRFPPWFWGTPVSETTGSSSSFENNKIIIQNREGNGFIAVGSVNNYTYKLTNTPEELLFPFWDRKNNLCNGYLDNINIDDSSEGYGSMYGLSFGVGILPPSSKKSVNFIVGIGNSKEEAVGIVDSQLSDPDIIGSIEKYWNNKISNYFSSAPILPSSDPDLNRIYLNSVLTYLVNRGEVGFQGNSPGYISQSAGRGQSFGVFPWAMGDQYMLSFDGEYYKRTLKYIAENFDFLMCVALDPTNRTQFCGTSDNPYRYSYNGVSFVESVYKYIVTTGDFNFLDESGGSIGFYPVNMLEKLIDILRIDESKISPIDCGNGFTANNLADYGNDYSLYEYNLHSNCCPIENGEHLIAGKYTGYVLSPNAERAVAYRYLADLYKKRGQINEMQIYLDKASAVISDINSCLWDENAKWFKTISTYNGSQPPYIPQKRTTPKIFDFKNGVPYLLMQYDNLLNPQQISGIMSFFDGYRTDKYGLSFFHSSYKRAPVGNNCPASNRSQTVWCTDRADWHGPGIYSGAIGAVLTGLFKNGYNDLAYDILLPENSPEGYEGYRYLKDAPYFSQQFNSTFGDSFPNMEGTTEKGSNPAYYEGLSIANSIVEGVFGFVPTAENVLIAPKIPLRLLQKGEVSLSNLNFQGKKYDLAINNQKDYRLSISTKDFYSFPYIFEFEAEGQLNLTINNLSGKRFQIKVLNSDTLAEIENKKINTDGLGKINAIFVLSGKNKFIITPHESEIFSGSLFN